MILNNATDIRIGTTQASKVYMGSVQVWPTTPSLPLIEGYLISSASSISANLNYGTNVGLTVDSDKYFHLDSWNGTLTSLRSCFYSANILQFLGFRIPTSNVTSMQQMFAGCSLMTSFTTPPLDTSNVTNINSMFNGCRSLTTLDLSMMNMTGVTSANYVFNGCTDLQILNLNNWNLSNISNPYSGGLDQFFPSTSSTKYLRTLYLNNNATLNVLTGNLQHCGSSSNSWVYVPKTATIIMPNKTYVWSDFTNSWQQS